MTTARFPATRSSTTRASLQAHITLAATYAAFQSMPDRCDAEPHGASRRAHVCSSALLGSIFFPSWGPPAFGTISILADFRDRLVEGQRAMGASDASLQNVTALGELGRASAAATALAEQVGRDRHRLSRVIRTPYFAYPCSYFASSVRLALSRRDD